MTTNHNHKNCRCPKRITAEPVPVHDDISLDAALEAAVEADPAGPTGMKNPKAWELHRAKLRPIVFPAAADAAGQAYRDAARLLRTRDTLGFDWRVPSLLEALADEFDARAEYVERQGRA